MPKTFSECDTSEYDLLEDAKRRWHSALVDAGVTIHLRNVTNRDKDDEPIPALKHHGYPAAAVVKINSLSDRQQGCMDATITVDEYSWQEKTDAEKLAILDHELAHLELKFDTSENGSGALIRDDLGRPKIKIRLHDWQMGGFNHIAERHGPSSAEQQLVATLAEQTWVQGALPFNR